MPLDYIHGELQIVIADTSIFDTCHTAFKTTVSHLHDSVFPSRSDYVLCWKRRLYCRCSIQTYNLWKGAHNKSKRYLGLDYLILLV